MEVGIWARDTNDHAPPTTCENGEHVSPQKRVPIGEIDCLSRAAYRKISSRSWDYNNFRAETELSGQTRGDSPLTFEPQVDRNSRPVSADGSSSNPPR